MNKKVIHSVIEYISSEYAERVAVEEECGRSITYKSLVSYSKQIAVDLVTRMGVKKGAVIGVYMESGVDYVATILGINMTGSVFMPLETSYPIKRLQYLIEKVSPNIILTTDAEIASIKNVCSTLKINELTQIVSIDQFKEKLSIPLTQTELGPYVQEEVSGDDSNYILYTSGSTGQPKIIEGCHKSLSHFIHWEMSEFALDSNIRVAQLAPISFDVSLRDIFVPLLCGGTLCVPQKDTKHDILKLVKWLGKSGITLLHTVPSVFKLITRTLKEQPELNACMDSLKYVLLAGEALYGRDVLEWRKTVMNNNIELINLYGPTETTLAKIYNRIGEDIEDPNAIIPLGKPISNTAVILILNGEMAETGEVGEIHIKTPFRSKGYLHDAAQNSERFIQNPLHNEFEDIVYKTGDLGRYLEDESIEFVGRKDSQIKIRGNRVELLEIEKVLMNSNMFQQVVVMAIKNADGEDLLTCYYVENNSVDETLVRNHVAEYLPDYMHPSFYVRMEEFPLNLNGKIDKRSFPRPEELLYDKLRYEAPANTLEENIATIWGEILGLKRVGVLNSFFELGGHSLSATRVISRIYKEMEREISLREFFNHPTVRELAYLLNNKVKSNYQAIEKLGVQEYYAVSHAQKRLWVMDQLYGSISYHMLGGCYINMDLNINAFNKVFQTMVERHESLRTTFVKIDGIPKQIIHTPEDFNFNLEYLDLTENSNKENRSMEIIAIEQSTPFDLRTGPLLRSKLIRLEERKYLFLFNMHHIISDGWSRAILINEILALYDAYVNQQENPLSPLRIHYKDYAAWQNNLIADTSNKDYQAYWHKKLEGNIPLLKLPVTFKRPEVKTYEGDQYAFDLNEDISDQIRKLCLENEVSLFMFFLSVLNIKLYIMTDEKDILIGCPIAGRNHPELENQIGFYLNNLILRNKVNRELTFREFLLQVKQSTLEAYEYQDYPYDLLIEELKPSTPEGRNPFYDVLLVMNNAGLNGDENEIRQLEQILEVSPVNIAERTSKLDLSFFVSDDQQISIGIEYSTELFSKERIEQMGEDFRQLLVLILDNQKINLGEVAWALTNSDKEELLKPSLDEITDDF